MCPQASIRISCGKESGVMATSNPVLTNLETIQGFIIRTSTAFFSRYAYFPFPLHFPTPKTTETIDNRIINSLTNAPHFPHINILDSISGNILYQTYNSFPTDFFHVSNLINKTHSTISFPYPYPFVNAAIAIHEQKYFKLVVVCIEQQSNPIFGYGGNGTSPLIFFIYSSKNGIWLRIPSPLTSDQLLPNRRKPVHVGEDIVYFDLTEHFLIRFITSIRQRLDPIPKLVSKVDEAPRYGGSRGSLYCAKFNPIKARVDLYVWCTMESVQGVWRLAVEGKEGILKGEVIILGFHPNCENFVFMRSKENDEIVMVDIRGDINWVIIGGKTTNCGELCFVKGMSNMLLAASAGGSRLKASDCGILHPHENAEGPEGEIFTVSLSGTQLVLQSLHKS